MKRHTSQNRSISFDAVAKTFTSRDGTVVSALRDIGFRAEGGQITCLLGPTGSGKSTLLRIVAGLDAPDSGTVMIGDGAPISMTRQIGFLTQRHTLFPWLTVADNIALPLEMRGIEKEERIARARELCRTLGIEGTESFYPYELSGGMQQRAALARLLASDVPYWLMDEPFNALDERTRYRIQEMLVRIAREEGKTVLFVTHSIDEAIFLADRVLVISSLSGAISGVFDVALPHPRCRVSSEFGGRMEAVRMTLESAIGP